MPDTGKLESLIAMNADARARGQPTLPLSSPGSVELASVILSLSTIGTVGLALWYAFKFVATSWQQLPALAKSPLAFVCGAAGVVAVGGLMCLLKRRKLLLYGSSELGVAIATGMMAIYQLRRNDDRWTFLLAVIGAMYVFARGSDNILTAIVSQKKSRQSEASSVSP